MKGKKINLRGKGAKKITSLALALTLILSPSTWAFGTDEIVPASNLPPLLPLSAASVDSVYIPADSDNLHATMRMLTETIGVRLMGTPNELQTANYIKSVLESYGYTGANLKQNVVSLPVAKQTTVGQVVVDGNVYYGNYYGPEGLHVSDPLLVPMTGLPAETEDLTGRVPTMSQSSLLALAGGDVSLLTVKATEVTTAVQTKGALAMVFYNDIPNENGLPARMSLKGFSSTLPTIALDGVAGDKLSSGNVTLIGTVVRESTWNVQAIKPATTTPDAIIHVTAHMDSVMGSYGASDNASGIAALLELARLYKDVDTGGVELRFVAVGAEEGGLNGSKDYVANLSPEEKAISINFNMDMIATDWPEANVVSLDINPNGTGVFNLPAALIIAGAEELPWLPGTENVRWYQYGASDHVSFQNAGIDAASMIRATDVDDEIEPEDHTPLDTIAENYSLDRLLEATNMMSKGIARAVDNELTLHVEYQVSPGGAVTITNGAKLKLLFNALEVTLVQKGDGATNTLTAYAKDDFKFDLPLGEFTMTVKGQGLGTANVAGTENMPKVLPYTTNLGTYDLERHAGENMSIDKVQVLAGGALQSQTRSQLVYEENGQYYTHSRMASMTDPRVFSIKTIVPYAELGINGIGQFDKNRITATYGGKELNQWKKLSGDTAKAAISIQTVSYKDLGDGTVEITTEILFDSFFAQAQDTAEPNVPYVGYNDTTKTGFPVFKNEATSPLGTYPLKIKYAGENLGELSIRLNLYDSFHTWSQVDAVAKNLMNYTDTNGNMINGKYVKVSSIGKSWSGRDIWNVVIAKNDSAVQDYLQVTRGLLLNDPAKLKSEMDVKKDGAEVLHKTVIYFNNVHPDETPGSDAIIEMVNAFVNNQPDKVLTYTLMKDGQHVAPTEQADGYTIEAPTSQMLAESFTMQEVLDNFILVFNFTENPDGRYSLVRTNNYGFDLNRDAAYQTQPEVVALTKDIVKWQPLTMTEYHGYVSELLMEPCTGPHDPNYEYDLFADRMLAQGKYMGNAMIGTTAYNRYLIPATDFSDGWDDGAPVYGPMFAMLFGTMGYTLEIPYSTQDSVDAVKTAGFAMMDDCLKNRADYVSNLANYKLRGINNEDSRTVDQYLINPYKAADDPARVVGRPRAGKENFFPEYYVVPVDRVNQRNPLEAYKTLQLLQRNGVELRVISAPVTYNGKTLPEGTYVVPMNQAARGYINSMMSSGYDGSMFDDIYAEIVIAFPEMRNFDRITIWEKGAISGKMKVVQTVQIPVTNISGTTEKVSISNNSIDAVRLVNRLLKAGKTVEVLKNSVGTAKKGDYVINRSDLTYVENAEKGNLLVYGTEVEAIKAGDVAVLKKPSVEILGSAAHSQYVLDLMEFDGMYKYISKADEISEGASVVVGFNSSTNVASKINGGIPYIGIGYNALSFAKNSNLLPGFDFARPGASYNEGLVKAKYTGDSLITAGYDRTDAAYIMNGTFITKAPTTGKALITISSDKDFFKSGWYPNHDGLKGQILAVSGNAGAAKNVPVTLFANNIFSKAHGQYAFNMFANAVYFATAKIPTDVTSGGSTGGATGGGASGGGSSSGGGGGAASQPTKTTPSAVNTPSAVVAPIIGKNFSDVKSGAWYEKAISFVTTRNLFTGTSDTTFSPQGTMTRGMLVTVLHRMEKTPVATINATFADVPENAWYADAVNWAAERQIVTGMGNGFMPSEKITREQLAVMLYRYEKIVGANTEIKADLTSFADSERVYPWAKEAMGWAVGKGIITGKAGQMLDPQGYATRAEVAAMLQRMLEK